MIDLDRTELETTMSDVTFTTAPERPSLPAMTEVSTHDPALGRVVGGGWLIEMHDVPLLGDVYLIPWW